MNALASYAWCLLALHLAVPALAADGIQIVKEPTGKAVQAATPDAPAILKEDVTVGKEL